MRGKNVVLVLLGAILFVFGILIWVGMTGGSKHVPGAPPGIGFVKADTGATEEPAASGRGDGASPGGPLTKTVVDKKVRDELRKRILAGWAAYDDGEVATAAREGRLLPMPTSPGGGVDPQYIRDVVRSDFAPLARKCYEELLSRKDAGSGRLVMKFKVVGDEKVGGIVEEAEIETEGGLADEKLTTCMRESLLSVAFRPPPPSPGGRGGWVTVTYPIELSPDDPDE